MKLRITNKEHVRSVTDPGINAAIDRRIEENIRKYTYEGSYEISQRIKELEEEWDIDRVLQLNAASIAITGIALSFKNKNWLLLSGVLLSFLALHSIQSWSPPLILLRRLGYRTRQEIECEIHAMKILRGDFAEFQSDGKRNADLAIKEALIAVF